MSIIAKVRVNGGNTYESNYHGKKQIGKEVSLGFVYHDNNPDHENSNFWEATPCGNINMRIDNQAAAEQLIPGDEYYMILTKTKPAGI